MGARVHPVKYNTHRPNHMMTRSGHRPHLSSSPTACHRAGVPGTHPRVPGYTCNPKTLPSTGASSEEFSEAGHRTAEQPTSAQPQPSQQLLPPATTTAPSQAVQPPTSQWQMACPHSHAAPASPLPLLPRPTNGGLEAGCGQCVAACEAVTVSESQCADTAQDQGGVAPSGESSGCDTSYSDEHASDGEEEEPAAEASLGILAPDVENHDTGTSINIGHRSDSGEHRSHASRGQLPTGEETEEGFSTDGKQTSAAAQPETFFDSSALV